MHLLLLIISVLASKEKENVTGKSEPNVLENSAQNEILVKIEEDEYTKKKKNYFGVSCNKRDLSWCAYRCSKNVRKNLHNGTYKDEETAAHASDTLARKLIANGEKGHKLNFPDDNTEVHQKKKKTNYIGLRYHEKYESWSAQRWSKKERKMVYNGCYKDEETAAHASDTLARELVKKGEKGHNKLNFPDDDTEVHREKETANNDIGVIYKHMDKWCAQRWSRNESKNVYNGSYNDKETAAHASDTLARKLISNGEKGHKLNYPEDDIEMLSAKLQDQKNKRKRHTKFDNFQKCRSSLNKFGGMKHGKNL